MLTTSGKALVVAAVALLVAGALAGYPELVAIGVACVLALLAALWWVMLRPELVATREISPARVTEGERARAVLTLSNVAARRSPPLLAIETVGRRRIAVPLPSLAPGAEFAAGYDLPTDRRGIHSVGPLTIARPTARLRRPGCWRSATSSRQIRIRRTRPTRRPGRLVRRPPPAPAARRSSTSARAYAEQFAAAFALLARQRAFASRVVVGYRLRGARPRRHLTTSPRPTPTPGPRSTSRALGWVVVEPTDLAKIDSQDDSPDNVSDLPPEAPGNDGEEPDTQQRRVIAGDAGTTAGGEGGGLRDGAALGGLALLAVVAAVPATAAAAKLGRRRRRRTAGDPATRVVGAWHETVDRLTEHGLPVDPAHTTAEVAQEATARFNGSLTAVGPLATLVAVAVFAPDEPPDITADHAWELERTARNELGAIGGLSRRAWSVIDPRPLARSWRRNVRSRPRAAAEARREQPRSPAGD